MQTIESVVSEALYEQLVNSSLPDTPPPAIAFDEGKEVVGNVADVPMEAEGDGATGLDLTDALTADAIRAAAQAAVAHGVGAEAGAEDQA